MSKLLSTALLAAVVLSGRASAQAPAPQRQGGRNITISDVRGSGNTVIVSGDGQGAVKVVTRDQGRGNRVIVMHNGKVVVPEKASYPGKDNKFWTQKKRHAELRMDLFLCPKTQLWFRYDAGRDAYLPAVEFYEFEARRVEREMRRTLDEVDRLLEGLDRELDGFAR